MKKYKEIKYYVTFDIETLEELVIPDLNKKNKRKSKKQNDDNSKQT
jgi:hypothetical protein